MENHMTRKLEMYEHRENGYKPLVHTKDWMVALMNWDARMAVENAVMIERHVLTDEVFILLKGKAAFYLVEGIGPLRVVEMQPGKLYNVPQGVWHNTLATKDVQFAIIENMGTNKTDTEERPLSRAERTMLLEMLPEWTC
jgi:mannose-6-phosphate isomerase-like protein (cupin superfamily)